MADLDAVNLGLDETERDMTDGLPDIDDSFDTRSEASAESSSSSDTSISSVTTDSSISPNVRRSHMKRERSSFDKKIKSPSPSKTSSATSNNNSTTNKRGGGTTNNTANSAKATNNNTNKKTTTTNSNAMAAKSYDYMTKINYLFRETRFFVIKSNNAENVTLSKGKSVWSTLPQNEANLNQAFRESRNVILIFSVKESGRFAGFARMMGESRRDVPAISWILPSGLSAKALGGVIQVEWVCKKELSFTCTAHLYNPWNEGKPVKIGRDGQEIETKVGAELCRLFPEDETVDLTPILKKSKESAKILREKGGGRNTTIATALSSSNNNNGGAGGMRSGMFRGGLSRGGGGSMMGRGRGGGNIMTMRGGRKKIFLTSRSKLNSIASPGIYKQRAMSPYVGRDRVGHHHWDRYSSTAAAEAYVADYMRTMQHQLPPMPYAPPPGFTSILSSPYDSHPAPPRYYDGIPLPDYNLSHPGSSTRISSSGSSYDKRTYDRSVEDFLWKTGGSSGGGAAAERQQPTTSSVQRHHHREYYAAASSGGGGGAGAASSSSNSRGHHRTTDRERSRVGRERTDYRDRSSHTTRNSYRSSRR